MLEVLKQLISNKKFPTMHYSSIFQQLFNFIPSLRFENAVKNTSGDLYCKYFTAWRLFLILLCAWISAKIP